MMDTSFTMAFAARDDQIIWQHVSGNPDALRRVLAERGFSSASFADPEASGGRAEFDDFQRFYLVRMFDLEWSGRDPRVIEVAPLYVWVDHSTVVSWAPGDLDVPQVVRKKLTENPDWVRSTSRLVYYLLDELLGRFFPFLDSFNDQIARVEQRVIRTGRGQTVQGDIFRLKREILKVRRIMASMRDAISQLVRYWTTTSSGDAFYYTELYDHIIRLFDTVDTYRELVNSALDLYMSSASNHMNEIVKTLSLVTTVLLPASLMAAIYGMNFDYLPLSHSRWGFVIILGIIGLISGTLYWLFRRRRWL